MSLTYEISKCKHRQLAFSNVKLNVEKLPISVFEYKRLLLMFTVLITHYFPYSKYYHCCVVNT